MAEQEKERINLEAALELQRQLDKREEVPAEATPAYVIDWNDPSVIRYHALQNRPRSVAEVRRNMCIYLTNHGGYKMKYFKRMSYDDIRPIFEKVWDQIHSFVPMHSELEVQRLKRKGQKVQEAPAETQKTKTEQVEIESSKKKLEDDAEKEELQVYLNIVSEDEGLDVESLSIRYPIVDWETQLLAADKYYYQIKRADGNVKHYSIFSAMLYDFDRQDVLELYRLVKERFQPTSPEGYDLLLWGDLKIMMEPSEEDIIWRNQQDWNLISWKLHNFCGVHVLLMNTGLVIHMMVEKKYPLLQDTLSKMLSQRLEVDYQSGMGYELIRFVKSQIQQ
ncbi:hypothetical protein Tco_0015005 [Tanacetum coccineum]